MKDFQPELEDVIESCVQTLLTCEDTNREDAELALATYLVEQFVLISYDPEMVKEIIDDWRKEKKRRNKLGIK